MYLLKTGSFLQWILAISITENLSPKIFLGCGGKEPNEKANPRKINNRNISVPTFLREQVPRVGAT